MAKRVVVGEAFDSLESQVEETAEVDVTMIVAKTEAKRADTRKNLAYGAVAVGAAFLVASASMGVYDDSFDELQSVWNVLGPIVGAIFGHYFGGLGRTNGTEN